MSVKCVPPQTPLLYSKTGVCMGIPVFLIFAPKHRLWVLVRVAVLTSTHNLCLTFGAKIRKISFFFSSENFQFLHLKKSLYIAWASFHNEISA